MTENRNPLATLALCRWLKDRVKEWEAEAKAELRMLPTERRVALVGGIPLASVTMARGRRTAEVLDEAAFAAWVGKHYPTEVETRVEVNAAFRKKLLERVMATGHLIDSDGVVYDGIVEIRTGEPYLIVNLDPEAGIAISGLLQNGRIGVQGLRALEEGEPGGD